MGVQSEVQSTLTDTNWQTGNRIAISGIQGFKARPDRLI